jgi:orotate phosphoribosyltransferase
MYATKKSLTPATLSGSESTYYCDKCYTTTSANTYYAIVGGSWSNAAFAGLFCVNLNVVASYAYTARGAALSYK